MIFQGKLSVEVLMHKTTLIAASFIVMSMIAGPAPAQFVGPGGAVPAVANLNGRNGSFWQSDVNVLNVSGSDTTIQMVLYPNISYGQPDFAMKTSPLISIPAGQQLTLTNVVQSEFGMINAKGALMIYSTDGKPLLISSRTYTHGSSGSYGQNVSSVLVTEKGWVAGIEEDSLYRTNVGIFWPWDQSAQFTIEVHSSNGANVGTGQINFAQAGLQQRSLASFGVSQLVSGYLVITCSDAQSPWYGYATKVDGGVGNPGTNDAVYRPVRSYQPGQ